MHPNLIPLSAAQLTARAAERENRCIPPSQLQNGKIYIVSGNRPTLPASFAELQRSTDKGSDQKFHLGPALNLGYALQFYRGAALFTKNETSGSLTVTPEFFGGLVASYGAHQSFTDAGGVAQSVNFGVMAGFGQLGATGGYDVAGKRFFIGIATKIDVFQLSVGQGNDVCILHEAV